MNPNQAPMHPSGIYNNQPQQHANNVIPSNFQPMTYQYPQQYLSPNPPVVGYNPVYNNPQASPQSSMGNLPQRDFLSGNQHTRMMHQQHVPPMRNQQMDVLSNIEDQYRPNPAQWPSAPRPFPNDQQFYQYPPNQQPMYMPRSLAPPPPPSAPQQQPNYPQMPPPFYPSYPQHITSHSSTPLRPFQTQNIKNPKKANAHQMPKNQNKANNNQNHNQPHTINQPKQKQTKSSKKQKKQSGHDSKKQSGRDLSSLDRIPTSTIIDKQIQKWGWVLPPLPQRSLSGNQTNDSSNPIVTNTPDSTTSDNQPNTGFTFSLKSLMDTDQEEEEELNNENNENNDDDILYNNDSDDDNNNNNNSDDSENNSFYNDDENDNDNESTSNSENNSDELDENNSEHEGFIDNPTSDLTERYRDIPVKRALFLWDQLFNP